MNSQGLTTLLPSQFLATGFLTAFGITNPDLHHVLVSTVSLKTPAFAAALIAIKLHLSASPQAKSPRLDDFLEADAPKAGVPLWELELPAFGQTTFVDEEDYARLSGSPDSPDLGGEPDNAAAARYCLDLSA